MWLFFFPLFFGGIIEDIFELVLLLWTCEVEHLTIELTLNTDLVSPRNIPTYPIHLLLLLCFRVPSDSLLLLQKSNLDLVYSDGFQIEDDFSLLLCFSLLSSWISSLRGIISMSDLF